MKQKSRYLSSTQDFFLISRDVAEVFGIKEAFVLSYIEGWLTYKRRHSDENERFYFDDRWWTFKSISNMQKDIRVYSTRSLESAVSNLRKAGVLLVTSKNARRFDRTLWYSIDYEKLDEIIEENQKMHHQVQKMNP